LDQRILVAEHELRECLAQQRLADARPAEQAYFPAAWERGQEINGFDAGLIEAVNTEFVPISLLYTFDDGIEHTLGNVGVRTTYADPAQLHLEQANASNYAMRVLDTAGAGYLHALKDTRFSMSIV